MQFLFVANGTTLKFMHLFSASYSALMPPSDVYQHFESITLSFCILLFGANISVISTVML